VDDRFGEMLDTPPEERGRYYDMIRRLTPEQRAAKVVSLSRAVRELARAGIRQSRPEASAVDVEIELVSRLYGPDAARLLAPHLIARAAAASPGAE
jgi:hypothetical protein